MKRDIDKILREKFTNHESTYRASMWDDIDKAINPPKKKNRMLFFGLIGLFLLFSITGMSLWYAFSSENDIVPISEVLAQNNSKKKKESQIIPSNSAVPQEQDIRPSQEEEEVYKNNNLKSSLVDSQTDDNSFKSHVKIIQPVLSKPTITSHIIKEKSSRAPNLAQVKTRIENDTKARASGSHLSITFTEPILDESITRASRDNQSRLLSEKAAKQNKELDDTYSLATLNWSDRTLNAGSTIPSLTFETRYGATTCPSWVKNKRGMYIDVYMAPEYAFRSITGKFMDSLTVAHQNQRNRTESQLLSYSIGARLVFLTQSGISFKTGINYSQINERFYNYNPDADRIVTIEDKETGEIIDQWTEYGEATENIVNRYKSIDVPLLIGFERYKGKKLSYTMNAGMYVNIYSEQRGKFNTPDGEAQWFTSGQDGNYKAYKSNVGASVYLSGGLMYHWVQGIDIFMEPSLRYYLKSFTTDTYPLRQNYAVIGLNTGIRYRF